MNSPELKVPAPRFARRVSSAPTPGSSRAGRSSDRPSTPPVETLIVQPDVKIVHFSTSGQAVLEDVNAARQEAGTWPPWSRTERTIAMGTLSIYRAPGSVAFLNCGSALQPILPKSQCWCIDEASSTFVLQIRRPNYWRIELGTSRGEQSIGLKDVLSDILQFEKTYCPFQRGFTVDIPEESLMEVKKKAWSPKDGPPTPTLTGLPTSLTKGIPEKEYTLDHRPSTAGGAIGGRDISGRFESLMKPRRSTLGPSSIKAVNEESSGTNAHVQLDPSPTRLSSLESPNNDNEENTTKSSGRVLTAVALYDTPSNLSSDATDQHVEASPIARSAQDSGSSESPLEVFAPEQPDRDDKPLADVSPEQTPSSEASSSEASSNPAAQPEVSLEAPVILASDHASEPPYDEASGRVSPTPSQDSFHSVSSRHSSLAEAVEPAERTEELQIDFETIHVQKLDDTSTTQLVRQRRIGLGEQIRSRHLANTDLSKNAHFSLVAKMSELILGPPAYLIALMVKIAAKIARGWRGPRLTYDYSDDDAPVFYDFSDSDLSE